ncbi:nascent polypeptide-associated complex subunit beta [Rhodotorula toruloides]|uniref:Nascent polypeptide-associated complex subunit beta n=1 Tax=Rhodotorula toruloides TaxID=5286 RepID=A0A511KKH1_RHOTO|nr:nascent polypeptide-associated complex subunit beta [Rhodotorula toruloides]
MASSDFDPEALKKLQARTQQLKIGGAKQPIRRKVAPKPVAALDDKKLQAQLKKLNVQSAGTVEEVNMFTNGTAVLNFQRPTVHAAAGSNVYAIYGRGMHKDLAELMPNVLNQLGPDTMAQLKRFAEQYQASQAGGAEGEGKEADDDEVPELVEAAAPAEQDNVKLEDIN